MAGHTGKFGCSTVAAGTLAVVGLSACGGGSGPASGAAAPSTIAVPATTVAAPKTTAVATTAPLSTAPATTTPAATAGAALARFPEPVRSALTMLAGRTTVPLAGPTRLDTTAPVSATAGYGSGADRGDTSLAPAAGGYLVALYVCPRGRAHPVNDPRIAGDCEGAATTLGGFAGRPEPSPAAAVAALPAVVSPTGGPGGADASPCPAGSPTTVVDRQPVATCGTIAGVPGPATVSWSEGEWTIVYSMGNGMTVTEAVGPLIRRLDTELLPAHPGRIFVEEGGDGEHTTAAWAAGSAVYSVFDYHDAVGAADLAVSTRLAS